MLGTTEALVNSRINAVRTRRSLQVVTFLGLLAVALSGSAGRDQPRVRCTATGGDLAVRYKLNGEAPAACKDLGFPGTDSQSKDKSINSIESYVPNPADGHRYT